MDDDWLCTQAIVSANDQLDGEKVINFGCIILNDMVDNECYILKEGDNTIGRHPTNVIYIEHPSVSMNHAVIQCDSDGVVLMDKGSLNKTKLNKKILKKDVAYFLEENAVLMFGEIRANYFVDGEPNKTSNASNDALLEKTTANDGIFIYKSSNIAISSHESLRTEVIESNTSLGIGNSSSNIVHIIPPNSEYPRTTIPSQHMSFNNDTSGHNAPLVANNNSINELEKSVPKNIVESEHIKNSVDDIHSSSASDEFLLDAVSQIETLGNNINSSKMAYNLSREDTPSPVMDFTDTLLLVPNDSSLTFSKDGCFTRQNNDIVSPNKTELEANREDTPSPVMDLGNPFQLLNEVNTTATREDTPSPIMNLGLYSDSENRLCTLETNNHTNIFSVKESVNKTDELDETQILKIDNNISEYCTQKSQSSLANQYDTSNQDLPDECTQLPVIVDEDSIQCNLSKKESLLIQSNYSDSIKCPTQSIVPCSSSNINKSNLSEVKTKFTSMKSEMETQITNLGDDFFECPTQKLSSIESSSSCCNTQGQQSSDNLGTFKENINDELTQAAKLDNEDFFNCPTQKIPIFNSPDKSLSEKQNIIKNISNTFEADDDDDIFFQVAQKIESNNESKVLSTTLTNVSSSVNPSSPIIINSNVKSEDSCEKNEIHNDDFFNCPTQITPKSKMSHSKNEVDALKQNNLKTSVNTFEADDDDMFSCFILKESKSHSCDSTKIKDEDFFNCPTQKVTVSRKIISPVKVSSTIHEEETQPLTDFKQPNTNKTSNSSKNITTSSIYEDLTQLPEMDEDDFFNCPTQKVSISRKITSPVKVSPIIHEEETQPLTEFKQPNIYKESNNSKSSTKSVHEIQTRDADIEDEDFFNCPTQKVSISRKISSPVKVSPIIHEEETQPLTEFKQPNKNKASNNSKSITTSSIREDLTQLPEMDDDDFFNCPTQKVSISRKITSPVKVSPTIHEEETQPLTTLKQPNKNKVSNSISITTNVNEIQTQDTEIEDEDFFNCPTQKVSISKKITSPVKVSPTIHADETQPLTEFKQPNTNKASNNSKSITTSSIREDLTQLPEVDDDDFFNCPTQKVSISRKIFSPVKVSPIIHEEKTQPLTEFKQPNVYKESNNSKSSNKSVHEMQTQDAEIDDDDDDDFFNCPTQKVSISKKITSPVKVTPTIHEEETQPLTKFEQPNTDKASTSKMSAGNVHEDFTQLPEMEDDDFFNCPTQKVSISKKIKVTSNVSSNVHEKDTQPLTGFIQSSKSNISASKGCVSNIHELQTQIPKLDDEDFFNCPTQKISNNVTNNTSSTTNDKETLHSAFQESNINASKTRATSIHEIQTDVSKMDDEDFFNCPTQKLIFKSTGSIKEKKTSTLDINEAETQDISIQSNSTTLPLKINSFDKKKQNKENIFDCSTKKVPTNLSSISNTNDNDNMTVHCKSNSNSNLSKALRPDHSSDGPKPTIRKHKVEENNVHNRKIRKSNRIENSKLNIQQPAIGNLNQGSFKSPKNSISTTSRAKGNLHISCSVSSHNKPLHNTNETISSPNCSKPIIGRNNFSSTVSSEKKLLNDDSVDYPHNKCQPKKINESVFSPLNVPNETKNLSSVQQHSTPTNVDSSNYKQSTSSNASDWQLFWNKKKTISQQTKERNDKQANVGSTNVAVKKERYLTRAVTRKENNVEFCKKRKQDCSCFEESNKRICKDIRKSIYPLNKSTSETVVTFSYLKSRHLKEMKNFVDRTGGSVTDEITQCTVLVTDKIRFTMKTLSAIARGCPIVNANWLKHSYTLNKFQDVNEFIVVDKDAERRFEFRLKESLAKARDHRLLDGYNILVTPSVKPGPKDMKACAGGNYVINWPRTRAQNELIVTCQHDRHRWKHIWDNDAAKIIDVDDFVTSIIRQKLIV